jgi:putative aminopeptidase FrvX
MLMLFSLANGGTLTCLVKIPVRYMHTHVETGGYEGMLRMSQTCFWSHIIVSINENSFEMGTLKEFQIII